MFSFEDGIKYIGLAVIFYFLIKAFADDKITNLHVVIIVVCIMVLVFFIGNQNFTCSKKIEGFDEVNQNVINKPYNRLKNMPNQNIYDHRDNNINELKNIPNQNIYDYHDSDINDLRNVINIDEQQYQNIKNNENKIMDKIRSNYKDDMIHTTTHPFNTIPLGSQLYGYTYLPPENWFRAYEKPPVCVTNNRSPIYSMTSPSTAGLMEFDTNVN